MVHEFSCCSSYEKCNYGRNECIFAESDPEKKGRCRCYKLKHSQPIELESSEQVMVEIEEKESFENQPIEQLSLF
jgi:hypothetical protein